jgi:hypothetical protein
MAPPEPHAQKPEYKRRASGLATAEHDQESLETREFARYKHPHSGSMKESAKFNLFFDHPILNSPHEF